MSARGGPRPGARGAARGHRAGSAVTLPSWLGALRREPRWLAGLAVAVVFAGVCGYLAQWQLDRRVDRAERNGAVLANYDAAPAPLAAVLGTAERSTPEPGTPGTREAAPPLDPVLEWTPVALRGSYDAAGTVLVRNRPLGGANGYLVAVPFTTADGLALVLVRGWVAAGDDAERPDAVPPPPGGTVEVVARLRPPEPATDRQAPAGQAHRLDGGTLSAVLAASAPGQAAVTTAYGVTAEERPAAAAASALEPVPRPETDPGPHLAYGVQWYLFAGAGFAIWAVLYRRHALDPGADRERTAAGAWTYDPGG